MKQTVKITILCLINAFFFLFLNANDPSVSSVIVMIVRNISD